MRKPLFPRTLGLCLTLLASAVLSLPGFSGAAAPAGAPTWTATSTHTSDVLAAVAYGGGQWVAVGPQGGVFISTDSLTWNPQSRYRPFRSITYDGGKWLAVYGYSVYTSVDLNSWRQVNLAPYGNLSLQHIAACTACAMQAVAVGTSAADSLYTFDGTSWTGVDSSSAVQLYSVTEHGGTYVAVGPSTVMTSTDGGNSWQVITAPFASDLLNDVTYGGGQFVAVGQRGVNQGAVFTSPDGLAWTGQPVPSGTPDLLNVASSGAGYVASGADGALYGSSDGTTWGPEYPGTSTFPYDAITYADHRYVAVGPAGWILTQSTNAILGSLAVTHGALTPTFSPDTTQYTEGVPHSVSSVAVIPTASDPAATVTVDGTYVASSSTSGEISLHVGSNDISVLVTAPNKRTTRTYTLTVNRAP